MCARWRSVIYHFSFKLVLKENNKKMANENSLNESSESASQPIPGYSSVTDFTAEGFKILKDAIKHANSLPQGNDWSFYNTFDAFPALATAEGTRILGLMSSILRQHEIGCSFKNKTLEEKTELLIEANDAILEKVANNIDELNGVRTNVPEPIEIQTVSAEIPINASWNRKPTFTINSTETQTNCIRLITAKNIIRPQNFFKDKLDNSSKFPWQPRIKEKPNCLKPLAVFLEEYEGRQEFSHPYEYELDRFVPLPQHLHQKTEPKFPKSLAETPLIQVETSEQLEELLEHLRTCSEFAVDLEHHSYRSFMGFTCLMQISTRDKDFLIDTLTLRDKLFVLNEVFTKPTIVKIFHGAVLDIEWLQRDLSLYIVNMFDTYQAAKLLNYPTLSLSYLLQKFCQITPNKQYQLADWRIRPLPHELKLYAREDTHYLIYIYESLKNELKSKPNALVKVVFERSTEMCKKRYFKPIFTGDSYMEIYRRSKRSFDNRQLYCLRNMYEWRDNIARIEDESYGYVLPNHMLLQISELLPREMQGILACCSPIPPLLRANLLEIHKIVLKAREQSLEKPILREDSRETGHIRGTVNFNSTLYCPHDLSKMHDFRDDLPTLFGQTFDVFCKENLDIERDKSVYSVFNSGHMTSANRLNLNYLSPFARYQMVKQFIQHEDQKEKEIKREDERREEVEDNRTDEERIASIREHFLALSRKFNEEEQRRAEEELKKQQTLLEMGGRKRIKRELVKEEEYIENSMQSTVPLGKHYVQRGKKRKNQTNPDENLPMKSKRQRRMENKQRKQNKQGEVKVERKQKKGKKERQQQRQQELQQQNQEIQNQQLQQQQQKEQQQQQQNNKKQKWKKRQGNNSNQNCFVPYDYTSVDFRQFQGGGGEVTSGQQVKSNFKSKAGKKMRNRNSKAATFVGKKGGGR